MMKNFVPARAKKGQEEYYRSLQEKEIVFVAGNAGCGKTFLAINQGLKHLLNPNDPIDKICIIRPYIFCNVEKLGALPGSLDEKVIPFVEAIRDNLEELLPNKKDVNEVINNHMEFLTLSTLRGRSLHRRFIIVEEAQNVPINSDGMLTILTRIGKRSRIVIAGDLSQCDLHYNDSAFLEAANALSSLEESEFIEMNEIEAIHRNKVVGKIIKAFQDFRKQEI